MATGIGRRLILLLLSFRWWRPTPLDHFACSLCCRFTLSTGRRIVSRRDILLFSRLLDVV